MHEKGTRLLRPTQKRLDELNDHARFFCTWFGGRHWKLKTELRAGLDPGQLARVFGGEERFSPTLLPKLRLLRLSLESAIAGVEGAAG